jgi:hypothetical protein
MIACDDHFLDDESMLKAMLRVFERRTIRTFRFRSISWVVSSSSFRKETRDVCVCVFVRAWWEKMQMKSVVFEKSFSSVEFRDFCLLRSILELVIRSLVNIKERREIYFVDRIQKFKFTFALQATESSLYSLLYSIRSQIILFYLNLLCCLSFLNLLNSTFVSRFVLLLRRQHDRFRWTAKTRSRNVLFRSESDLDHKKNERNDVWTKVHDAARMSRLLYTETYSHERSSWKDMILNRERLLMKKISQRVQRLWERISRHSVNSSTSSKSSKDDWWSHESYCWAMRI